MLLAIGRLILGVSTLTMSTHIPYDELVASFGQRLDLSLPHARVGTVAMAEYERRTVAVDFVIQSHLVVTIQERHFDNNGKQSYFVGLLTRSSIN